MWQKTKLYRVIFKPISGEWGEDGNQIKVIRTTNFTNNGSLNLSDVVTRKIDNSKVEKKKLRYGDTIIEKSGGSPTQPVGRVVFFDQKEIYLCNNFTSIIRPTPELNSKYLFWFLFNNHLSKKTLKYQNKTTGIINLKLENYIIEIEIPLPPLAIQEKIADILDKADELRRKDQELQEKYTDLTQAMFLEMFGNPIKNEKTWEMGTIRNMVKEVKYGTSSPAQEGGEFPYLRMNNITYDGYWDFKSLKYINASEDEYNKYGLHYNDLVFNRTNSKELVGKTAVYKGNDKVIIAGYLIRIRVNEKAHPDYIAAFLNSTYGKLTLSNMCKNIVGQANINAQELQDIKIPIPPTHLQKEFSRRIEIINNLKAQNNLEKSEELFQSLLQKAFTGELIK